MSSESNETLKEARGDWEEIAQDVARLQIAFVNLYAVGAPDSSWTLIDAGLPGSAAKIKRAVEARFGAGARPEAILLTHGHVDHAGAARALADEWNVPVYAHYLELPYLTGESKYPPPDPTIGGAMAFLSRFFPTTKAIVGSRVQAFPPSDMLPHLAGWQMLHTPGHTPGHVSFFRKSDRILIAGDALATMNLDSYASMLTHKRELARPPAPFTIDWDEAQESVRELARLKPRAIAAGHGEPIKSESLAEDLQRFADGFAPPRKGRYVNTPAKTDEHGIVCLPPPPPDPLPKILASVAAGIAAGALFVKLRNHAKDRANKS